jgi:hypothetical protein
MLKNRKRTTGVRLVIIAGAMLALPTPGGARPPQPKLEARIAELRGVQGVLCGRLPGCAEPLTV